MWNQKSHTEGVGRTQPLLSVRTGLGSDPTCSVHWDSPAGEQRTQQAPLAHVTGRRLKSQGRDKDRKAVLRRWLPTDASEGYLRTQVPVEGRKKEVPPPLDRLTHDLYGQWSEHPGPQEPTARRVCLQLMSVSTPSCNFPLPVLRFRKIHFTPNYEYMWDRKGQVSGSLQQAGWA